jgi:hypothetical protein
MESLIHITLSTIKGQLEISILRKLTFYLPSQLFKASCYCWSKLLGSEKLYQLGKKDSEGGQRFSFSAVEKKIGIVK